MVESILAKSVVSLTGLAAVFGAVLAYASRVFAVHRLSLIHI